MADGAGYCKDKCYAGRDRIQDLRDDYDAELELRELANAGVARNVLDELKDLDKVDVTGAGASCVAAVRKVKAAQKLHDLAVDLHQDLGETQDKLGASEARLTFQNTQLKEALAVMTQQVEQLKGLKKPSKATKDFLAKSEEQARRLQDTLDTKTVDMRLQSKIDPYGPLDKDAAKKRVSSVRGEVIPEQTGTIAEQY